MRTVAALLLLVALASPARAADAPPLRRFAVVAGASLGGPGRSPLRYATSDARDVSRVLRRLGGVALDDLVLLEEPDADRLRGALGAVAAKADRARAAGGRVEVFLYYSGHSDEQGLLLGASRLGYGDLRRELDRVPADVRVAILDSCASGAITRTKGGVHRPPFLLDTSSKVSGHAFLTSSAADEAAQESDRLRASFFTHALLTGLRGAADTSGDGVVTLNEAYQFAFRETLAGTEGSQAGPQHATYDIGLVGSGDVVMTDLRRADAVLVVPEPVDGRVFVRNASGQLVAELRKVRGARIELALEEGRYAVQVATDRQLLHGTVDLAASGRVVLDEARLAVVPREPTTSRGPDVAIAPAPSRPPPAASAPPAAPAEAPAAAPPPLAAFDDSRFLGGMSLWILGRGGPAYPRERGAGTGGDAELAAGAWLRGTYGLELAAGYRWITGTRETTLEAFDLGTGFHYVNSQVRDELSTYFAAATLKIALLPERAFRPYLLGGGGIYFTRVATTVTDGSGGIATDELDFHPGVHAGAGFSVALSPHAFLALEGRFQWGKRNVDRLLPVENTLHVSAALGFELF